MVVDTINLVDTDLMKRYENLLMAQDLTDDDLILRAGRSVAGLVNYYRPEGRILVLCGPGKNGCDGMVAASCLQQEGRDVIVSVLRKGKDDRVSSYDEVWQGERCDFTQEALSHVGCDIVVDSLFGTGLSCDLDEEVCSILKIFHGSFVCAVDIPSGVDANTGEIRGGALKADVTATFGYAKIGHYLYPGRFYTGKLVILDIDSLEGDSQVGDVSQVGGRPSKVGGGLQMDATFPLKGVSQRDDASHVVVETHAGDFSKEHSDDALIKAEVALDLGEEQEEGTGRGKEQEKEQGSSLVKGEVSLNNDKEVFVSADDHPLRVKKGCRKSVRVESFVRLNHKKLWSMHFPRVHFYDHKYSRGLALVIAGAEMVGASILASKSAQRMGVGILWVASRSQATSLYRLALTSVVVKEFSTTSILQEHLEHPSVRACLVGQGLDSDMMAKESVLLALRSRKKIVLDGTALMHLQRAKEALRDHNCEALVLTPHEGEFSRLFPEYDSLSKVQKALAVAKEMRAFVVLKGGDTVIASPDGRVIVNAHASEYLSVAGTGDVLAGMIVSLLAQGMPTLEALACSVWIHGDIAQKLGVGMIAEDMPAMMQMEIQSLLI